MKPIYYIFDKWWRTVIYFAVTIALFMLGDLLGSDLIWMIGHKLALPALGLVIVSIIGHLVRWNWMNAAYSISAAAMIILVTYLFVIMRYPGNH